ncbi:MAG: arylsulfatase [Bacteroides sp.]|uniref:arylsulfatase n=1 Tax=Bacteroides sp. TaxID=29523 RepID=UPI002FCAAA29|nr:arylsulfatase [Bacteroides sp.]
MKITNLLLSITALAGAFPVQGNAQAKAKSSAKSVKPNIIYILADDLGRAELGSYGQQLIETPHLDALRNSGMLFTNHYSGTAVSAPSRCVLFTGLHTGHAYIRGNDEGAERGKVWDFAAVCADSTLEGQRPVPANTVMIPKALKQGGYTTACIGKWGLGFPGSVSTPNKMGFDFFYGYNCQRQSHTYFPTFLYRNEAREYIQNELVVPGTKLDKGADPKDVKSYAKYTQQTYAPDLMYDELIKFVQRSKKEPFALFWTTPVPHVPLQAPERWVKHYVDKFGDEEPYLGNKGYFPCRYPRATYAAMVSYWDEQVGGLIAELKRQGIYENTIILFTSDNGPTFNGGSDSPWFDSAKPFKSESRWGKCSLREGGIRTPLLVSWPKKVKAGTTNDVISAFWDMMPTMCDIAGVPSPETDGISLLPSIIGQPQKVQHDFLYWEYCEAGGEKAVRMGKWKGYIQNILKGNREIELYNLDLDPREQTNVARYNPEVVAQIKEIMKKEHIDAELKAFNMPE